MARNTRIDRPTDIIARRAARAATIIPTIHDHLNEQRSNITALGAGTGNTATSGTHSDPTLRTAMALDAIDYHRRAINDQIYCLEVAMNALDEVCRNALGHQNARTVGDDHPRCPASRIHIDSNGNERESACDRMASYRIADGGTIHVDPSGLCDEHLLEAERDAERALRAHNERRRYQVRRTAGS